MSDNRKTQIKNNLITRETEDLIEIWENHDTDEWDLIVFEVIEEILMERLGYIPPLSTEIQVSQILDRVDDYLENNKLEEALRECETAIKLDPNDSVIYNYRGEIYDEMGKLNDAITNYQKAVEIDPEYKEAWENLLIAELGIEEEFEESVSKEHLDQALEYAYDEEIEKVLSECEAAKSNLPNIAIAYNYMGLILQTANQFEDAIEAYSKAIKLNPRFFPARENLASAKIAWEEEQYLIFSNLSPIESHEVVEIDETKIPESEEPIPQWLYMNEKSFFLIGYPGFRTKEGRSGYDPLDRNAEQGRFYGIVARLLLDRKFRTRNPLNLFTMTFLGVLFSLYGLLPFTLGPDGIPIGLFLIPYSIVGIAMLVNVYLSLILKDEDEDNGYTFF